MEENKNYTIAEDFELPSKGLIYSKEINPHVRIRSSIGREEMRRTGRTKTQYKVLADMIDACILDPKPAISVYDMCLGDFEFLLHKWRIVTYGEKYPITSICPYCNKVEDVVVDLDKEELLPFDFEEYKALLTVTLPATGKVVTLKYKTPRMLDDIKLKADEMLAKTKDDSIDYERLFTIRECIDLVDGQKLSYIQMESFVDKLPARDVNKIERRLEKLDQKIGLKNEFVYHCSKCNEEVRTFFRFGPEFFRPADDE